MKTITLKADDSFFDRVSSLAKQLQVTKSELIRTAVVEYDTFVKKRALKEQIRDASLKVRRANREIVNDFDHAIADGLGDV